jgi:precorrin-6Y C5,15-methyltransferase (decarboxylating)
MTQWLSIIGMGEDGYAGLSTSARLTLERAEVIIASDRMFALLPPMNAERHVWPQPFSEIYDRIKSFAGRRTVLLATGDPMNFGVARKIFEIAPHEDIAVIPHLSAFSLAAARMGWSLPDCDCFTIHGRPAANLETFVQPDAKLLVLTQDESSIDEACRRLVARGFQSSMVTVLENMGGERERKTSFRADQNPNLDWSALNTLAIHCIAGTAAKIYARVPGLPDDAFVHDGKITKREIRAMTIAALAPAPNQTLWDVGAGSGSISIEWMRSTRGCQAYAIEPNAARRDMIATNADRLGTPRLFMFNGTAPDAYAGLPPPDAVFIGGGIDHAGVFEGAWKALPAEGNLVANTVTLEGDARLIDLQKQFGGDLVRMDVSTLTNIGDMRAMRPRMSVLQWRVRKP